jgi:hypothetical protein
MAIADRWYVTLRRTLIISGIAAGVLVLIAGALTAYAFFNLSSIVARNEKRLVESVSNELAAESRSGKYRRRWDGACRSK